MSAALAAALDAAKVARRGWRVANARRRALIEREITGTLTPAETDELAALQARADAIVRPSLMAALARVPAVSAPSWPLAPVRCAAPEPVALPALDAHASLAAICVSTSAPTRCGR